MLESRKAAMNVWGEDRKMIRMKSSLGNPGELT